MPEEVKLYARYAARAVRTTPTTAPAMHAVPEEKWYGLCGAIVEGPPTRYTSPWENAVNPCPLCTEAVAQMRRKDGT